jgi:hypothetical protein
VLGLNTLQMNHDHDYGGVVDNQLRVLERLNLLRINWQTESTQALRWDLKAQDVPGDEIEARIKGLMLGKAPGDFPRSSLLAVPPARMKKLVNPYDPQQPLDARARSYLHANCAHCHISAGGGNSQMDLEFTATRDNTHIMDAKPQHHTFGIDDARIVALGDPKRSVLWHRVSIRDRGQMPQLSTVLVDRPAVDLLREWIEQMPRPEPDKANP